MFLEPSKQTYDTTAEQGLGRQPGCASTSSTASLSSQHHHLILLFHQYLPHSMHCLESSWQMITRFLSYLMVMVTQLLRQHQRLPLIGQQYQAAKKWSVQDSNYKLKLCRPGTTSWRLLATASKEGSEFGMDRIKHNNCLVAFYDQCRTLITNWSSAGREQQAEGSWLQLAKKVVSLVWTVSSTTIVWWPSMISAGL